MGSRPRRARDRRGRRDADPRRLGLGRRARRTHLRRDRRLRHELRCARTSLSRRRRRWSRRCAARCATPGLDAAAIGYVSGHGTATELGDIAESHATRAVFGERIPISCMKSYFGHTLGACGAQEAWLAIEMMNRDAFRADAESRQRRSALREPRLHRGRAAHAQYRVRHEQQLRFRRHQYLADFSPRVVTAAPAPSSSTTPTGARSKAPPSRRS